VVELHGERDELVSRLFAPAADAAAVVPGGGR